MSTVHRRHRSNKGLSLYSAGLPRPWLWVLGYDAAVQRQEYA